MWEISVTELESPDDEDSTILDDIGIMDEITGMEALLDKAENTKRAKLYFDIETGPIHVDTLKTYFDASKIKLPKNLDHPGTFDPNKVKTGNIKIETKKIDKINRAYQEHQKKLANWSADVAAYKQEVWETFVEEAPLDPLFGQVLAIGYGIKVGDGKLDIELDIDEDEESLLLRFWQIALNVKNNGGSLVGYNSNAFDLPFLTVRSWKHGLRVPYLLTKYRKFEDWCVDIADYVLLGRQYKYKPSLDKLAKFLGTDRKLEGITGDLFHKLLKTDREKAEAYLKSDIKALAGVVSKIDVFGDE